MAFAFLQRTFDDPYAMQLPAVEVRVDDAVPDQFVNGSIEFPVGVVRDVHFFLAYQFEIVAIKLTGETVGFVIVDGAAVGGNWRVISKLRSQPCTALSGGVNPAEQPRRVIVQRVVLQDLGANLG
ncbi:hypothetical protein D3C75_1105560 [compost metagenome]